MAQVNVNIEELKRMATMIAAEQIKMQNSNNAIRNEKVDSKQPQLPQQLPQQLPKQKLMPKVQPKSQVADNSDSTSDVANIIPAKSAGDSDGLDNQQGNGNNMLGIFGFYIPKQTLYFLLIMVAIAVAIWYMSRDAKSSGKKRRRDEDE